LQGKDKHPEITKAQKALFNAKSSLEHSARDVGGHRAKAVQAIDQALAELKLAAADK
jgi:F0F1-type ATP synthase epsilon subunit